MPRLSPVDLDPTNATASALLETVHVALGVKPNMMRTMAERPQVLQGYLSLNSALAQGRLGKRISEQIALAVAEANGCHYCAAAHTLLGKGAGLSEIEIAAARDGEANDQRGGAAIDFALAVLATRGRVSEADLANARASGLDDGDLGEVIAHVALNVFTNYFNAVADTEIDFPAVRAPRES